MITWRKMILGASLAVLAAGPGAMTGRAAPAGVPDALSGQYSQHFKNGDVQGDVYWSDDVVEIVPVAPDAAYLRVELAFYNGHSCSIYGIAKVEADRLVYRAPPRDDQHCVLTVSHDGANLRLSDGGSCKDYYCGERGSFDRQTLPFASRRKITYMPRLKASKEFGAAMSEWHKTAQ